MLNLDKKVRYSIAAVIVLLIAGVIIALLLCQLWTGSYRSGQHRQKLPQTYVFPEDGVWARQVDLVGNTEVEAALNMVASYREKWNILDIQEYHLVLERSAPWSQQIHDVTVTRNGETITVYQVISCELVAGQSGCVRDLYEDTAYSIDGLFTILSDQIRSSTEESCVLVTFSQYYYFPERFAYNGDCDQVFDAGIVWYLTYFEWGENLLDREK